MSDRYHLQKEVAKMWTFNRAGNLLHSQNFLSRLLAKSAGSILVFILVANCFVRSAEPDDIWVGVAKVDITPRTPVVLAGYGGRTAPFEKIETKLWARALVLGKQNPSVMVVLDNCGVTRKISDQVKTTLSQNGFKKDRIVVAATHTHNAPNLVGYAPVLWQGRMTDEQKKETQKYTDFVVLQMVVAVLNAKKTARPARLEWGQGRVSFGRNRRVIREGRWAGFGVQPDAPVDHSLPFLVAKDKENQVIAIWANYACHCTTLGSGNFVAGDWAGFANDAIEKQFQNAVSLVSIGTGADVGPQPSGSMAIAKQHGNSLGNEIKEEIEKGNLEQLKTSPTVFSTTLELPLEQPKDRAHWSRIAKTRGFEKQLAIRMLNEIDTHGSIADTVEYPISCWKFGDQLAMIFMPGEVVVDYAVRLKTELDWQRTWITAWANRMPGYIPSRKVLMQGGYEADFSQIYYGLPGRYKPDIENLIVREIHKLVGKPFEAKKDGKASPYHQPPSQKETTGRQFRESLPHLTNQQRKMIDRVRGLIPQTQKGMDRITSDSYRKDLWFNLYGDRVKRAFIRQEKKGETLQWQIEKVNDKAQSIFCFTAGLGWISQPKDQGFELIVNDADSVKIDVVQKPATWNSQNKSFELIYIPTWTSNEDSAGFFFLVFSKPPKNKEGNVTIAIRSTSAGSQRWFGLDTVQNLQSDLRQLNEWLKNLP